MTEQILDIADEVQAYINKSYNYFSSKFLNIHEGHRFEIKQEMIAKAAFWVTKKRYGQWIINDGGTPCEKLDVKGLDIVRSSFPPAFRDFMTKVLKAILAKAPKERIDEFILNFKNNLKDEELDKIALPTGVKGIQKYTKKKSRGGFGGGGKSIFTEMEKGAPVHTKASVIYNDLLRYFKVNKHEAISNGNKVRWVYLKQNPLKIDGLAYKGYDDPKQIIDFINQYVDRDKLFDKALKKKIQMFYDAMSWDMPVDKKNSIERFF